MTRAALQSSRRLAGGGGGQTGKLGVGVRGQVTGAQCRIYQQRRHGLLERHVEHIPGTPESPLSEADLQNKFRECATTGVSSLGQARGELLLARFNRIEHHADMADCFAGIL